MTSFAKTSSLIGALLVTASTVWAEDPGSVMQLELMPGWTSENGALMAGLHITLEPGWKTYWRMPGEAGIPPEFSWSGSDNLRAVRIHWPQPEIFETYGQRSIGYTGDIILPVELFPRDAAQPITIDGEAAMGVCKDICLPINLGYSAVLDPSAPASGDAALIQASLDQSPKPRPGQDNITCQVEPISDGIRLTANITVPRQGGEELVFFEPGQADIWVSPPEADRQGQVIKAVADLVPPNAQPFALDRSALRFTVLGSQGAVDMVGCLSG